MYFGLDTPNATDVIDTSNQPDNLTPSTSNYATNPSLYNTYNLPGGAMGDIISDPFSLQGDSSAQDPTLYFTYDLNTRTPDGNSAVTDTMRVYVIATDPNGNVTTTEVATNNTLLSAPPNPTRYRPRNCRRMLRAWAGREPPRPPRQRT